MEISGSVFAIKVTENLNIDGGLISNAYMDEWRNGSQCIGLEEITLNSSS